MLLSVCKSARQPNVKCILVFCSSAATRLCNLLSYYCFYLFSNLQLIYGGTAGEAPTQLRRQVLYNIYLYLSNYLVLRYALCVSSHNLHIYMCVLRGSHQSQYIN